jgi:hypothetical protein
MAGFDKYILMEKLKAKGWEEIEGAGSYMMKPPRSLFDKYDMIFHVYDAESLQNLLGEAIISQDD